MKRCCFRRALLTLFFVIGALAPLDSGARTLERPNGDTTPPTSQLNPIPAYSRSPVALSWQGTDGSGVGVSAFELQYQREGESWRLVNSYPDDVLETAFLGNPGQTYSFRVRAIDFAGNAEAWRAVDGRTTFYTTSVAGLAMDVRERPLPGAVAVAVNTAPLAILPADAAGHYATYLPYRVVPSYFRWSRYPYLSLPDTVLPAEQDNLVDVYLPSPDNIVNNWGFEADGLAGWQFGGTRPPVETLRSHSGQGAAQLGSIDTPEGAAVELGEPISFMPGIQAALDAAGRRYVVWGITRAGYETSEPLHFAVLDSHANLLTSEQPFGDWRGASPQMVVATDGTVDLAWARANADSSDWTGYLVRRTPAGTWQDPIELPAGGGKVPVAIAPDGHGGLHLVTHDFWPNEDRILYLHRDAAGVFDAPVALTSVTSTGVQTCDLAVDGQGSVHVVWTRSTDSSHSEVGYRMRSATGEWSPTRILGAAAGGGPVAAVAANSEGLPYVLWHITSGMGREAPVTLSWMESAGTWTEKVLDASSAQGVDLTIDGQDNVHLAWARADGIAYQQWRAGQAEPDALRLAQGAAGRWVRLAAQNGHAVATWTTNDYIQTSLHYAAVGADGWGRQWRLATVDEYAFDVVLDAAGEPVIAWHADAAAFLWQPPEAPVTSDKSLSQHLTIPASLSDPTLSFMYDLRKPQVGSAGTFEARVRDRSGIVTTLIALSKETGGWSHAWADLTAWSGQTITLEFVVREEMGGSSLEVDLDEATVSSSSNVFSGSLDLWLPLLMK